MIHIDDSEPEDVLEPAFPYHDVAINRNTDAKNIYEVLSEIGRGKFGTVYRCQEKATGLKLAAKFVPIPKREDKRNVEREVEIMNSLQHHLIIQLYAAYEYHKMMCVVLELVEGGELFDRVVDDEFVLTERVCIVFIRQVCEAMEFIHRNNILHLDLKPENILCLTQKGNRIKIIDFGLARKFDPNKRLQILFGTPEFVAPEVVNFDCISYGTDMWSVGVICYVLISGLSPFMGETDIETMANVTIAKYDFEDESFSSVSSDCLDFISKLLVKDLSVRMTAAQCLNHKWLQRRPKPPPVISPKPLNVQPPKLKTTTKPKPPSPVSKHDNVEKDNMEAKKLDTTKDNLKNFIERWEEHPNSPYVFDIESNVISPLNETMLKEQQDTNSISSSRVCSPSPCESIATVTDEEADLLMCENESLHSLATPINESREKLFITSSTNTLTGSGSTTPTLQNAPQHLFNDNFDEFSGTSTHEQQRSIKSYLHTFDRRNSDTSYLVGRRASGERINLADEIRKLSDHLLMLAEINTKLGNESEKQELDPFNAKNHDKATTSHDSTSKKTTTTTTTTASNTKSSNFKIPYDGQKMTSLTVRLQQTLAETPKLTNGRNSWKTTSATKCIKSKVNTISNENADTHAHHQVAAPTSDLASCRRAKFRINQMSRDVPIGLPDSHQTVNLEEAANTTKDCLLHLLEKYNETKCRNPLSRHQSISVDWQNLSDNLEYRSMSSINAFFQRHNNTGGQHVKQLQAQLEEKATGK